MACLGIDIGTTSIKCCYYDKITGLIHYSQRVHDSTNKCSEGKNEQSVSQIFGAIHGALEDLTYQLRCLALDVEQVSLCCQMHGIVFWDDDGHTSDLVTWQDQRCDSDFLSNLKTLTQTIDLHKGYGCATLAWLTKYEPQFLEKYTHCGSIADIFTSVLCGFKNKSLISDHNAQSWGFFDHDNRSWNEKEIKLASIKFKLPQIIKSGSIIGEVVDESYLIQSGAKVFVPIGDLQASVYSVLGNSAGKVFNYGTASQLVKTLEKPNHQLFQTSIRKTLYTDRLDLATAASLNGGNAVEVVNKLFNNSLMNTSNQIFDYDIMMELAYECKDTTLKASPVFFGERHDTKTYGSFFDIKPSNFTIGDMSAAIFCGIVENLCSMMPDFESDDVPFFAVGISGRKILQYYVKQKLGDYILYEKDITAAYGAILYDIENEI